MLLTTKILFNWIPPVSLTGGIGLSKECPMGDARGMLWYAMEYPKLDEKNKYIY